LLLSFLPLASRRGFISLVFCIDLHLQVTHFGSVLLCRGVDSVYVTLVSYSFRSSFQIENHPNEPGAAESSS